MRLVASVESTARLVRPGGPCSCGAGAARPSYRTVPRGAIRTGANVWVRAPSYSTKPSHTA